MADWSTSVAAAIAFALFSWWLGTGAILWLVRRRASSFPWSLSLAFLMLLLGLLGSGLSMRSTGSGPAYLGFASVILMWSWHELAFLTGWLTGPRQQSLDPSAQGWLRLRQSVQAVAYHELALLINFCLLWWMQAGHPNHVALCTFALLWCMRLSAKLNLYLGVPQTGAQYLPAQLSYMASYFRCGRVTPFFFTTLGLSVLIFFWLIWEVSAGLVSASTGAVLLATLLGLAIVEHLLMAFPLSIERLWGWAMTRPQTHRSRESLPLPAVALGATAKADPP
ncbi:MAG: putative photosynthetic complex assembly protein PuhE [Betaproteobacteria bacterium]